MKIESVGFHLLVQPQEDPSWTFATGAYPTVDGWIVVLTAENGVAGHGYAEVGTHMGYTAAGMQAGFEVLKPCVLGRDSLDIEKILIDLDAALVGNGPVKAGIDMALHDLAARLLNLPLHKLLGGPVRREVQQTRILQIKPPAEMAEIGVDLVQRGYRYLKVKLKGDAAHDLAAVAAIRKAVGPKIHLTLDANQSYSPKEAIRTLNRMEAYDVDLVEQPVPAEDLAGLALVTRSVGMMVEADEAAITVHDVLTLVANRTVDAVSLKIGKLGGLRNTLLAARICATANIRCRIGATFGSRLYAAHALHLAAAMPRLDYACEIAEFDHILEDPYEGIEVEDGLLKVPETIGSGVTLRPGATLPR